MKEKKFKNKKDLYKFISSIQGEIRIEGLTVFYLIDKKQEEAVNVEKQKKIKQQKSEEIITKLGAENKVEALVDQVNLMRKTINAFYQSQPKSFQARFKRMSPEILEEFEKVDKIINEVLKK